MTIIIILVWQDDDGDSESRMMPITGAQQNVADHVATSGASGDGDVPAVD